MQNSTTKKIVEEIFNETGEKVTEDDPLVIASLISHRLLESQSQQNKQQIQALLNQLTTEITKATQVKKRNRINTIILFLTISNTIFTTATLLLLLKLAQII